MALSEVIDEQLAALAGCVCEKLSGDDMCFCGIVAGETYISLSGIGDCGPEGSECGEAWVRITGITPSNGSVDGSGFQNGPTDQTCETGLEIAIEIGVLRCIEISPEAWTVDQMLEASNDQLKDMNAIRDAVLCCDHFDDANLGEWSPMGPDGGLLGGIWTMTALVA